ncbi:sensor histidine kinase [Diaminobutyricimonas sp. LJ205]|uniref:sensor histidine kinase n=1 Tax=Diaminobutyricimonas sp. LJ205 TaxID=2683590 RepID=UPI0012F50F7F|nr:ATP-binding protein [Diaminobutyricimonas sp. LJ205]
MSLGLPAHLAPGTISRALARASHGVAASSLAVAAVIVAMLQVENPELILLPAILALVPIGIALVMHEQRRSISSAAAYLLVGAAATYWFVVTLSGQYPAIASTAAFTIGQLKIALILVAHGRSGWTRLGWCTTGYVAAELAVLIAIAQTGGELRFDLPTMVVFFCVAVMCAVSGSVAPQVDRARPALHRAIQDEEVAGVRERERTTVTALVHDTILNTLTAIAATPPGELSSRLQEQIEKDLAQVAASDLAVQTAEPGDRRSRLLEVLNECAQLGLEIETTGEIAALDRLGVEPESALALAVKQCLVNVATHAGTTQAQVAIYGGEADVSVLVIDTGRGFGTDDAPADRLGMRMSVHRRVAAVGGSTRVWSTPGRGTAVLMEVPVDGRPADD